VAPEEFVDWGPFDVVLELIGAPNIPSDLDALALDGRIVVIGVGGGGNAELNLLTLMAKRGGIHASLLRPRPLEGKARAVQLVEANVLPLFDDSDARLQVPVAATYPMQEADAAYDRFLAGGKLGKIVLTRD
jgi:NADPH:quinone reductase-like Zn-dependent oxidoreductase